MAREILHNDANWIYDDDVINIDKLESIVKNYIDGNYNNLEQVSVDNGKFNKLYDLFKIDTLESLKGIQSDISNTMNIIKSKVNNPNLRCITSNKPDKSPDEIKKSSKNDAANYVICFLDQALTGITQDMYNIVKGEYTTDSSTGGKTTKKYNALSLIGKKVLWRKNFNNNYMKMANDLFFNRFGDNIESELSSSPNSSKRSSPSTTPRNSDIMNPGGPPIVPPRTYNESFTNKYSNDCFIKNMVSIVITIIAIIIILIMVILTYNSIVRLINYQSEDYVKNISRSSVEIYQR